MNDIEQLAQNIIDNKKEIDIKEEFFTPVSSIISLASGKWFILYELIQFNFITLYSATDPDFISALLNALESKLSSLAARTFVSKETVKFAIDLSCITGSTQILKTIRNNYTIIGTADSRAQLKRK